MARFESINLMENRFIAKGMLIATLSLLLCQAIYAAQNQLNELSAFFDQIQNNFGGYNAYSVELTPAEMEVYYTPSQKNNYMAIYFAPVANSNKLVMRAYYGPNDPTFRSSALNAIDNYFSTSKEFVVLKKRTDAVQGTLVALYRNPNSNATSDQLGAFQVKLKP